MQTFKFICATQDKTFYGFIAAVRPTNTGVFGSRDDYSRVLVELDEPWAGDSKRVVMDKETGYMRTEMGTTDFLQVDQQEFPRFQEACYLASEPHGEPFVDKLRQAS